MDLKLKDNNKLKFAPFIQLEYIESTGTQYIDTGIKADNNNQTFKIGISFLGNDQVIGSGERNRNQATATICRNTNKDLVINWGTWSASGSVLQSNYPLETLAEIEIKAGNVIKLNGDNTTIIAQNVSFTSGRTANFILNGSEDALDGSISGCVIRTHYFIVENDGREIIHLIPSKHNNIPCMYDTVTETFFYNSGTGNFIAGPSPIVGGLLPNNITLKTTTFYHKNTPNVDGLQLLNGILYVQETAEDVVLNRIRVDIGNVSGPISQLLQYAGMAGFNDNYEPQTKPRLVGTWTINNWYTTSQLSQARSAFDGLTIVEDPNYVLDFSEMAVQVLDPNEDNYNPAVAIALNSQNRGTTTIGAPCGYGRWFLTKTQAAAITDISNWFYNKSTVTDTNGLVTTDTTQTYDFESFDEFEYFGVTYLGKSNNNEYGFCSCSKLQTIQLPNTCSLIRNSFRGCSALSSVKMPDSFRFDVNDNANNVFSYCSSLETIDISGEIGGIIPGMCFAYCYSLKNITLSKNITRIRSAAFLNVGRDATFNQGDEWELDLPNLITNFDDNGSTFEGCLTLTKIKSLGSITSITYRNQFKGCGRLKTVILPETLTTLDSGAFYGCSALETINLPDTLVRVTGAFTGCSRLKLTSIPSSVTQIGAGAFNGVGVNATFSEDELLVVNLPNLETLSSEGNFQSCKFIKELRLGKISTFPYRNQINGCSNLKFLELPYTLASIENAAFSYSDPQNMVLHILAQTPPSISIGQYLPTKTYVGEGSSSSRDDAILAAYLADTNWATYSSRLDTWYNYLHPQS